MRRRPDMSTAQRRAFRRGMGMTSSGFATYEAFCLGGAAHYDRRGKRNPYPPGRRHDEYERGFNEADPMGDHHGRNV